jgi:hypothetical protein
LDRSSDGKQLQVAVLHEYYSMILEAKTVPWHSKERSTSHPVRPTPQRKVCTRSDTWLLRLVKHIGSLLLPRSIKARVWGNLWKRDFFQHFWTRCITTKWPSPTPLCETYNADSNFSFYTTSLRHIYNIVVCSISQQSTGNGKYKWPTDERTTNSRRNCFCG